MKRLTLLLLALFMMIPSTAMAADLDELLEKGREASYSAEQIITCATPDGRNDAVVQIAQAAGDLQLSSNVDSGVEVTVGYGDWSVSRSGDVVASAEVEASQEEIEPRYEVDEGRPAVFLGRRAMLYEMRDGDLLRAQLIFDAETGAMLRAITYNDDGQVYCERRFIAFDPETPDLGDKVDNPKESDHLVASDVDTVLPEKLAGFHRLDLYADPEGFIFGYYSDGFFSFAVFETPALVVIDQASEVSLGDHSYGRAFTPGMVTYSWETAVGAMALIGDLPPDMHQDVLSGLPSPVKRGWLGRLWRSLFG